MKHDHFTARCVFIDGPLALYICQDSAPEILAAYRRLEALVEIAARQLNETVVVPSIFPFYIDPKDWPTCGGDRNASEFP